jgi:hypothetical protein
VIPPAANPAEAKMTKAIPTNFRMFTPLTMPKLVGADVSQFSQIR